VSERPLHKKHKSFKKYLKELENSVKLKKKNEKSVTPKPKISEKPVKSKPKKIVTPKPIKKEKPVTQKLKKEEAKDKNKFKKYLKKINRSD
jgi:hypothetical protein